MGQCAHRSRQKRGGDCLPSENVKCVQTRNFSWVERETGLEPATACLEDKYFLFHRLLAARPYKFGTPRASTLYGGRGAIANSPGPPAMRASVTNESPQYSEPHRRDAFFSEKASEHVSNVTSRGGWLRLPCRRYHPPAPHSRCLVPDK